MGKDINLTSSEWTDIVFEGRNKEYGAYTLRQSSSKRHIIALLAMSTLLVVVAYLPSLIKSVTHQSNYGGYNGTTEVSVLPPPEKPLPEIPIQEVKPPVQPTITFTPPEITDKKFDEKEAIKSQTELEDTHAQIATFTQAGTDNANPNEEVLIDDHKIVQDTEDRPFVAVEQVPQFPGGEKELMSYISKNLKYPTLAVDNGIQGRVILRFVVSKTGDVTDVQIMKGLDPSCDKEAIRVVKSMPKWVPGRQNGKNVAVYYTLPITYKLQ